MNIQSVLDEEFRAYGQVWDIPVENLLREMKHTPLPDDVIYTPSVARLESVEEAKLFETKVYGGLPIQIGYCNGHNNKLNAVEYHRNSEINVAVTDMILLLGLLPDVKREKNEDGEVNYSYDTSRIQAFLVPAGTVVEMYETTLHYAPCSASDEGFRCVVILPRGTNTDIDFALTGVDEDKLMTAKNKWLIAHEDAHIEGAYNGLVGENIEL